jgi:hypothetical protein
MNIENSSASAFTFQSCDSLKLGTCAVYSTVVVCGHRL